jgi:hypothetical protein
MFQALATTMLTFDTMSPRAQVSTQPPKSNWLLESYAARCRLVGSISGSIFVRLRKFMMMKMIIRNPNWEKISLEFGKNWLSYQRMHGMFPAATSPQHLSSYLVQAGSSFTQQYI